MHIFTSRGVSQSKSCTELEAVPAATQRSDPASQRVQNKASAPQALKADSGGRFSGDATSGPRLPESSVLAPLAQCVDETVEIPVVQQRTSPSSVQRTLNDHAETGANDGSQSRHAQVVACTFSMSRTRLKWRCLPSSSITQEKMGQVTKHVEILRCGSSTGLWMCQA